MTYAKLIGAAVAILFVIGIVYAGYRHIENLQERALAAEANAATAKAAFETEKGAVVAMQAHVADLVRQQAETQARVDALSAQQQENAAAVTKLQGIFAKHDMEKLADAKPKLVERAINAGSDRAWGLLRDAGTLDRRQQAGGAGTPATVPPAATARP